MYPTALRNVAPPEREGAFFTYVGVVCGAALLVLVPRLDDLSRVVHVSQATFALLAALAVVADLRPLQSPGTHPSVVFPSICFTFAILLMWGFAPAAVVQTAAVIGASVQLRHAPWRAAFNAAQYTLAFAAAGAVLALAKGSPFTPNGEPGWVDVLIAIVAASAWFAVNYALVAGAVALRFGLSWWSALRRNLADDTMSTGSLLLLGAILVGAIKTSAALIPLVIVPLYAVNRMARLTAEQQRVARTDSLTGLPNRKTLMTEVSDQIAACLHRPPSELHDCYFALLVLDIDRFKHVNDALGHPVGDRLLVEIAHRIQRAVRTDDMVARLGGDEFAVICRDLPDFAAARAEAQVIADVLSVPVMLDGLTLDVGASIGIAAYPAHGADAETLLRHADVAMYDAKSRGDAIAGYASEVDHNSAARLSLLADLRRGLETPDSDEVRFYYQPQVEMATGAVVGVEALLRWYHPTRGLIDPEELIRVAEHSGVMRLITRRVVDDVVAQLAKWRANGLTLRASINVSVRDLHSGEVVDRLAHQLAHHAVAPEHVQLEITEGALMADPRRVLTTLQRLDRLGVALSLDDFGTGYSSMQHLRRLPLSEVKIDRSFVLGMAEDTDDEAIVRSMIGLADALGLRVVAEGVEDDPTRKLLVAAGCHVAQGWFYARPMPADELASWLARYRPPQQVAAPEAAPGGRSDRCGPRGRHRAPGEA